MERPRALVLHDGELDRITAALERAGVEPHCAKASDVRDGLPMPCDLLISTGKRTLAMPALRAGGGGPAPTWICVHTQDFHPLRERLRALGVHFLVQATIEDRPLELFLSQLLHRGEERRREPRLPVGATVELRFKGRRDKPTLVELSASAARIETAEELPVGAIVELELPTQLAGKPLALSAQVARCEEIESRDGVQREVLLRWHEISPIERQVVDELAAGKRVGPRVAALSPAPYIDGTGIPDWGALEQQAERRSEPRREYRQHVDAFAPAGVVPAIGRDLTLRGVCIETGKPNSLAVGDELTLALHAGGREEPVLASARVDRRNADGSVALSFRSLDDTARRGLERILGSLPVLSSLSAGSDASRGDGERIVAAELRPA